MSALRALLRRSTLPVLIVLCLAALTASFAYAEGSLRPLATTIIGDPDAAVTGKFAVGTGVPGSKALTVAGVIDFVGAGTVHNFFTQGPGNNMQIRSNVDETNTVYDATKSQWNMVMGSANDMFMIKHSPAGATYNEDALFWIYGSTGRVGIGTFDTANGAALPFVPQARLHVQTNTDDAVWGVTTATSGSSYGVYGESASSSGGGGVVGLSSASTGTNYGVYGLSASSSGRGVYAVASATSGTTYGLYASNSSPDGYGVFGAASATSGVAGGVWGQSASTAGYGVVGYAFATSGDTFGVWARSLSSSGTGVYGYASATTGDNYGVHGVTNSYTGYGVYGESASTFGGIGVMGRTGSTSGHAVYGDASATNGTNYGVYGQSNSPDGYGVAGNNMATSGQGVGVYGHSVSTSGVGVYGWASATTGDTFAFYGLCDSPTCTGIYVQHDGGSGYGIYVEGDIAGTGTKSAIVETDDYGWRSLYAVESPQNWFEDFGQATLVGGKAVVPIEPIFAQTVNLNESYHLFLTPRGGFCSLYLAETSPSSFTVRAVEGSDCEITFDYRIIAPRLDYEDLRLKEAEDPEAVAASIP